MPQRERGEEPGGPELVQQLTQSTSIVGRRFFVDVVHQNVGQHQFGLRSSQNLHWHIQPPFDINPYIDGVGKMEPKPGLRKIPHLIIGDASPRRECHWIHSLQGNRRDSVLRDQTRGHFVPVERQGKPLCQDEQKAQDERHKNAVPASLPKPWRPQVMRNETRSGESHQKTPVAMAWRKPIDESEQQAGYEEQGKPGFLGENPQQCKGASGSQFLSEKFLPGWREGQ